jgi:hypothetical protein
MVKVVVAKGQIAKVKVIGVKGQICISPRSLTEPIFTELVESV